MVRTRALIAVLILFLLCCFIPTTTLFGAHGDGTSFTDDTPGPSRREGDTSGADLDTLKKQIKEGTANSAAWWKSAHEFLSKVSPEDGKKFAGELDGARKDHLNALVDARGNTDLKSLRSQADTGTGAAKDAARQEVYRRMQDPNAKLTAAGFGRRIERAIDDVEKLKKMSPEDAGKHIAKLMMRELNKAQRENLVAEMKKILGNPDEIKKQGLDEKLLKWYLAGAEKSLLFTEGGKQDLAKVVTASDSPFARSFAQAYKEALGENENFYKDIALATKGDAEAKKRLFDRYDPETVMDFIGSQLKSKNDGVAVDVARGFGRTDDKGNFLLDASASSVASGDAGRNQVLFLGKDAENIRAALSAFMDQSAVDHEVADGMDPGSSNRFARFRLNPDAAKSSPTRVFAGPGTGGSPKLTTRTDAGWPEGTALARQGITTPNVLPDITPTPSPTPTPTPGAGGAMTAADVGKALETKCSRCHGTAGGFDMSALITGLKAGTLTVPVKQALNRALAAPIPAPGSGLTPRTASGGRQMPPAAEGASWVASSEGQAVIRFLEANRL